MGAYVVGRKIISDVPLACFLSGGGTLPFFGWIEKGQSQCSVGQRRGEMANPKPHSSCQSTPVLQSRRSVRLAVVPSSRPSPRLQGANVDSGEFLSLSEPVAV